MKSESDFHFKQFSVAHDRSTHKIGTDGVLLGAWVDINNAHNILEIGTGTGVIALMLAQRTNDLVHIDALEISKDDADQARENVGRSPWPSKINVIHSSVQQFNTAKRYDLVVSNPPYFINSWRPPDNKRSQARHTDELSFNDLLHYSVSLMKIEGRLAVILPVTEGTQFITLAKKYGLLPHRKLLFRSRVNKPIERIVMELSRQHQKLHTEELILHSEGETWSDEYRQLTREFYLKA